MQVSQYVISNQMQDKRVLFCAIISESHCQYYATQLPILTNAQPPCDLPCQGSQPASLNTAPVSGLKSVRACESDQQAHACTQQNTTMPKEQKLWRSPLADVAADSWGPLAGDIAR